MRDDQDLRQQEEEVVSGLRENLFSPKLERTAVLVEIPLLAGRKQLVSGLVLLQFRRERREEVPRLESCQSNCNEGPTKTSCGR